MDNGNKTVLIAGESWTSYGVHVKGFSNYYTGSYEEGVSALRQALESSGLAVEYLPNHLAGTKFPATSQELSRFAAVLMSDISSDTLLLHPNTLIKSVRTPNRLRALAEYVEGGGGLAMIGGWMSFAGFSGQAR
ncbi:MAG: glutamine amidotransferase [Acidobacteriota bacterium]